MTPTPQRSALVLHAAPFVRSGTTTGGLMRDVLLALLPVFGAAVWYFGLTALLVVGAATIGAVAAEIAFNPARPRAGTLKDGSAILTGVVLGLTLPPGLPLWMAFVGGAVGVGIGKVAFGGLGQNLFNPALVGRAFLQAAFPTAMTTWAAPDGSWGLRPESLEVPLSKGVDAVSTATPLAQMKFEQAAAPSMDLLFGNVSGSLGETSALVLIVVGVLLALRRAFDWRIPVAILLTVFALSGLLFAIAPQAHPTPWFMLLSGGLLYGSVFMATDPVTSPTAPRGAWIFGVGVGVIVVLVRRFGGLPEGVMYAILLMNAATPLIERYTQPKPFGRRGKLP